MMASTCLTDAYNRWPDHQGKQKIGCSPPPACNYLLNRNNQAEVFYILAKGYLSHELGMLGFPAYDRSQLLLGFYKEVQSQGGQTQVRELTAV